MPLNNTVLNIGANAMRTAMAYVSLHSATPDPSGSDESDAPRRPSAWSAPTNGDLSSASILFTGGESNGPVKAAGFWNSDVGGDFYGFYPIDGDEIFNASGEYTLLAFTLVGSSD